MTEQCGTDRRTALRARPLWEARHVTEYTGWTWRYMMKLVEAGLIEPVRPGGHLRRYYRRDDVLVLLKETTND